MTSFTCCNTVGVFHLSLHHFISLKSVCDRITTFKNFRQVTWLLLQQTPISGFDRAWGLPASLLNTLSSTGQPRKVSSDSQSDTHNDCVKVCNSRSHSTGSGLALPPVCFGESDSAVEFCRLNCREKARTRRVIINRCLQSLWSNVTG